MNSRPSTRLPLDEPFRPQFHFTPPVAWMNDPNGLVYYSGEYHLFYQYHPHSTVWGPMHWGHAVSPDLVNWQHLPITLYPDELGNIYSGSAVIDWTNSAGFGQEAMIAIFTHSLQSKQSQSLAYSTDRGRSWTTYRGNPVIVTPPGMRDFRDPKVFWHEADQTAGHWVMLLAAGDHIQFYRSPDLKSWRKCSEFGKEHGSHDGVWETPDLFRLPVEGGAERRWVLAVAVGSGGAAGGSAVQYFTGEFDGETFMPDDEPHSVKWADFGADFYAAQRWNDAPSGRNIWAAWMNNWLYAREIPTITWRGALTLPRELSLISASGGVTLRQQPVHELQCLRGEHRQWKERRLAPGSMLLDGVEGETLEIIAEFRPEGTDTARRFGFRLLVGEKPFTTIGYDSEEQAFFIDRSRAVPEGVSGLHLAPFDPQDGAIRLHIFLDRSSVELFANGGRITMTDQLFPPSGTRTAELFSDGGEVALASLDIYRLHPARFTLRAHHYRPLEDG